MNARKLLIGQVGVNHLVVQMAKLYNVWIVILVYVTKRVQDTVKVSTYVFFIIIQISNASGNVQSMHQAAGTIEEWYPAATLQNFVAIFF